MAERLTRQVRLRVGQVALTSIVAAFAGFPLALAGHFFGVPGARIAVLAVVAVVFASVGWLLIEMFILPQPRYREETHVEVVYGLAVQDGRLYFGDYPYTARRSIVEWIDVPNGQYAARVTYNVTYADDEHFDTDIREIVLRCEDADTPTAEFAEFEIVSDSANVIIADRAPEYYRVSFEGFEKLEHDVIYRRIDRRGSCVAWIINDDIHGHCLGVVSGEGGFPVTWRVTGDGAFEVVIDFQPEE